MPISFSPTRANNSARAESDRRFDETLQAIEDYYTGVSEEVLLDQQEFHGLAVCQAPGKAPAILRTAGT